jgi:hypothetical protein
MKSLVTPLIDRRQWLEEFSLVDYSAQQQDQLWELVSKALEMQALDALLDRLNQENQRALIQHLAEDALESQVEEYLQRVLPGYHQLLEDAVVAYKKQLRLEFSRLKKHE